MTRICCCLDWRKGPGEMSDKMEGRFVAPSVLVPDLGPGIDEVIRKAVLGMLPKNRLQTPRIKNLVIED